MTEVAGPGIDAPQLVRPRDELAFFVPAVDPGDAVVESEEAHLDHPPARVLDPAVLLPRLVVWDEEIALEHFGIPDGNRICHPDGLPRLFVFDRSYRPALFGVGVGGGVGAGIFVGCNKIPTTTGNVFINARDRQLPVLSLPRRALGPVVAKPFVRREEGLGGDE